MHWMSQLFFNQQATLTIDPPDPCPSQTARQVMDERGEEGAIKPHHLREAHRRAVKEKRLPVMRPLP